MMCYSIHEILVPMVAEVSDPSKVKVALAWSYFVGALFKVIFSLSGFLTYTIVTSEVILDNLPAGIPVKVIATFFTLNVLLSYPVLAFALLSNIEDLSVYEKLSKKVPPVMSFVGLRIFLVLAVLAIAVFLPHFALVNSFVGCFAYIVTFLFPGLFHLRLKYKQLTRLEILADVLLIILGIFGFWSSLVTTTMSFVAM